MGRTICSTCGNLSNCFLCAKKLVLLYSRMEDKRELLKQPLHSVFIPIALILFGTSLFGFEYLPYSIAFIVVICTAQVWRAMNNRSSIEPLRWNDLELIDKTIVLRNSAIYRFKLKHEDEVLDVPTGHHVACCMTIDGIDEVRYYSPISNKFDAGFFDILVKSYPEGKVSKRFAMLREGQTVKFRGPVGRLTYVPNLYREIGIIAGGSGITPILQVITEVITNPKDNTKLSLIYANETANDILLKTEIDEISSKFPNLKVHYTLTTPPKDWTGSTGYVTKEMMETHLPKPSDDARLLICGPPEMKRTMIEQAEALGWPRGTMRSEPDDQVFCF